MALFDNVPREVYNDMKERAVRAEALLAQSIPVKVHDEVVERLGSIVAQLQKEQSVVVTEAFAMKRHDLGMVPKDWTPGEVDTTGGLGPLTMHAIEGSAGEDREIRNHLIAFAHQFMAEERAHTQDTDELDKLVSRRILDGDE